MIPGTVISYFKSSMLCTSVLNPSLRTTQRGIFLLMLFTTQRKPFFHIMQYFSLFYICLLHYMFFLMFCKPYSIYNVSFIIFVKKQRKSMLIIITLYINLDQNSSGWTFVASISWLWRRMMRLYVWPQ